MTRDELIQEMQAAEGRAEAALVSLVAAYTHRGEMFEALVRGAYNAAAGDLRNHAPNAAVNHAFTEATNPRLSQDTFAKNLLRRMRHLGLGGMLRHRVP